MLGSRFMGVKPSDRIQQGCLHSMGINEPVIGLAKVGNTMSWNSIQSKFIGLVLAGCLALSLAGIWGGGAERAVSGDFRHLLEHDMRLIEGVERLNMCFKIQVQEWKNLLLRGYNPADGQKHWQAFMEQHRMFDNKAEEILKAVHEEEDAKAVRAVVAQHDALLPKYEEGRRTFEQAGFDFKTGDAALKGVDDELSKSLEELVATLNRELATETQELAVSSETIATRTLVAEMGLTALVLASQH